MLTRSPLRTLSLEHVFLACEQVTNTEYNMKFSTYVGLDSKFDQIYITISFHPNNPKFKYLSLLSGKVIFPKFQNV
jgi:hypothetical protein